MPHFIIECSKSLLEKNDPDNIMTAVYQTAELSGLFSLEGPGGIKVRINPYNHYLTVGEKDDFIHVFANIMEGRTEEQKKELSKLIVAKLTKLFPNVSIVSMNVSEFEKNTYHNRAMIKE